MPYESEYKDPVTNQAPHVVRSRESRWVRLFQARSINPRKKVVHHSCTEELSE
ncbi:hypothetical protein F441_01640 [Phytophthora nicotianae CJ01A1]|uniref:Uncharacterized protein n=5 Tax=Phytophthora nicotianae TaxID=4792 RepID=W2QR17_PHYN3|nr:hypothetical protein PPTG_21958 [Phytophthora nicotianae INRA-310]ETI55669.1 hypothetical protein F443_01673 [Phytophthora nicotianae P1569]ETK95477.1 hypothetical protein L915_01592 [Phytophthora nicotianae]ETO84399.1 hypothetical protein F444_01675 [Phytophthora nicotianae P1976]ETP25478.1 hypothetical protein F441_01640 [Phytophthora nicotianae CJ01A1]ETM01911.1 hypothetical protein L917_01541 [Phytophthora nicotianae]